MSASSTQLPILEIVPKIVSALEDSNTLIVSAPPGAGKSTLLPLMLMNESWLKGQKILMLEPRRLAAKTIAARMSEIHGSEPGSAIGYRVRFENRVSSNTQLEVLTEGILTRMLQNDNSLEGVGMVIFDEFHERSLHADLALTLCRESQQVLRPDLRILVMSATLNLPGLSSILNAPVIESSGKMYPVEIKYCGSAVPENVAESVSLVIMQALLEEEGDILVFLPGEGEIKQCEEILRNRNVSCLIHPLYGQLPQAAQIAAILPDRQGRRKIVLATSIAETSLTIEGVRIVIDSGFSRNAVFDSPSGLSRLQTIRVSKDSADQRAGRAGRMCPGVCYRLWSHADHLRLEEHRVPEILQADLAPMVLDLAAWGIQSPESLSWINPPPSAALAGGREVLHRLNALDNNKITKHGREMLRLPCHPRIAHMLLSAGSIPLKQLATDVAAILEEKDPLGKEAGIDINLRIEALRRSRNSATIGRRFQRIEKIASGYRKLLQLEADEGPVQTFDTGLLLAYAYPERIAVAKPGSNARFQLANGKYVMASHTDDLAHEPWLAVAHADMREGTGKIFMASSLDPKDLIHMVKEVSNISWDTRRGGIIASNDLRIGSLILQSKPILNPDQNEILSVLTEAIRKEGESLLSFDESFQGLQNRFLSLRAWNPQDSWPDVRKQTLIQTPEDWLSAFIAQVKRPEDFKKINLRDALMASLSWEKQQELSTLAPHSIEVPTGSSIRLEYSSTGEPPVLAVRLQELFGLAETPMVNGGKVGVILHLLSPGYKPVQVTSDLKSFWNNTYFEVKKELKRRYPKHSWPDDPWNATPVAKGRSTK